jgi:hypothetical protein
LTKAVILVFIAATFLRAQTQVRFSAGSAGSSASPYQVGPFPTNSLTTPDLLQPTGLQINLPASEDACGSAASPVCSNNPLLNQLDGFSVNPRLMVCFSAPVNPATIPDGISLVPLPSSGSPLSLSSAVAVDQVIFDPGSNCAFAKPVQVLNQQTRYLLVVTNAIADSQNLPVAASSDYQNCVNGEPDPYCSTLASTVGQLGVPPGHSVVAASLFTTMTATSWLEQARQFVDLLPAFVVPAGPVSTFALSSLKSMTWAPDKSGTGPQNIPLSALSNVASVSFGLFFSPGYIDTSGSTAGSITRPPILPVSYNPVSFHAFLPAVRPGAKIPVVIYGHGLGDSQFGAPTYIASTLAKNGFATLAIEITGHGYGPNGTVQLTLQNGSVATVSTPGRGVQLTPGGNIGSTDGCIAPGAIAVRDCARQSAVDLSELVHAIRSTGGLGLNLDPNRIYYVGQSFGSTYGTLFTAVEPAVQTAVLNGAGGTSVDIARLAITGRPLGLLYLSSLNDPVLLNVLAGLAPPEPYFHDDWNDNYVFRGQPPVTNTVGGAMTIQAAFEAADWLGMLGDPLAFAPHLATAPLNGVPAKHVLFQFGFGDLEVPNPTESAVLIAANAANSATFFNFAAAAQLQPQLLGVMDPAVPGLPILPHRVLSNPTIFDPANSAELSLSLAEQQQTADYFVSNGTRISDPNTYLTNPFQPEDSLFQTPPTTLPEALNFLQVQP